MFRDKEWEDEVKRHTDNMYREEWARSLCWNSSWYFRHIFAVSRIDERAESFVKIRTE